jgi:hypothetical protein
MPPPLPYWSSPGGLWPCSFLIGPRSARRGIYQLGRCELRIVNMSAVERGVHAPMGSPPPPPSKYFPSHILEYRGLFTPQAVLKGEKHEKQNVHRKKRFPSFPSPAGMSLTKLPHGRNNSVMTSLFPPRESLEVTSRLGTGNSRTFFYGVCFLGGWQRWATKLFLKSANRKFAKSWAHSAIANPQIS